MINEEICKSMMNLYNNFLFRKCFFDFFRKVQLDGIEAARKFWDSYPHKNVFSPHVSDLFERMIDFYIDLSLVPAKKHDELLRANENLQLVNTFLIETVTQLNSKIFAESGERVREAWESVVDKQLAMNKEMAKNFFDLFRQNGTSTCGKGIEKPFRNMERRREIRQKCAFPVEFNPYEAADKTAKGVVLNVSDSGLCINSSISLNKGQEIRIESCPSIRHQTFTVQWSSVFKTGLSA
jgi:hypothetical protein